MLLNQRHTPTHSVMVWNPLKVVMIVMAKPRDCIHSSLPRRTSMVLWIITKQLLLHQDAE
jgi:hypothetical protein